jgi:peptidyl-prolyl cis-trans isomerase D
MLQQLRSASKSWVASVIIGILVLAFALWGVADIFRGGGDNVVADVGGSTISDVEYDMMLKGQLRQLSAQTQTELTMDQAKAMGLDKNVLDTAISRTALDEQAKKLGLTASRQAIETEIKTAEPFRGADGAFDFARYAQMLRDNSLTEQAFLADTGKDIARNQLIEALADGVAAPPGLSRLLYDYLSEQRVTEYLVVMPEDAGKVPEPTQAQLEAYHKSHGADFSSPEYRSFDYVQISPEQFSGEIQVSDADLKAEFDANKAKYEKPEQRQVEQITFPTKEAADAAAAKIKTAADFAAVAKERGLKDQDLNLGTLTATGLDPKLSAAVFAVPEGGVTPPVQGPFGWVILRAAKVIPGETKTLDQVKDEIKGNLVKARIGAKLTEVANKFEDDRGSGDTLAEAAMKQGLTVHHIANVDKQGMTPERSQSDVPKVPLLLQRAFQTETGEESDLFQAEDGQYFAVNVKGVTPPAVRPLDSVREEVREAFIGAARAQQLAAKVKTLADQGTKANSLADAAKALGRPLLTSQPLKRDEMSDVFSPNLLNLLFTNQAGTAIAGTEPKSGNVIIARVTKVLHPEPDLSSAVYSNFRREIAQQLGITTVDTVAAAARKQAGVTVHQATVQRVLGDTPQQ